MKIYAINGSPRKSGNSMQMLQQWVAGFTNQHPQADVQVVNLYDLTYTGCRSCFACKRKGGRFYGTCPIKDGIHDLIANVQHADAVAIAAPMYFGAVNAYTMAFLERLIFSVTSYRMRHESVAPKDIPFTMLYTMNAPQPFAAEHGYDRVWDGLEWYIANAFRTPVHRVAAYFTYQFRNYDDYEMEMFSEPEKRAWRDTQFPLDLKAAYAAGADVAANLSPDYIPRL